MPNLPEQGSHSTHSDTPLQAVSLCGRDLRTIYSSKVCKAFHNEVHNGFMPQSRSSCGTTGKYVIIRDLSPAERCESGRIGQSRKLLSWQRDRGFDPHPLRQTKLARADSLPGASILFIWFVLFVWFEERKKPDEPDRPDQPVSLFISAFSFKARLSSTIAKVSRAQYRSRASSIVARSTQSVSTKTMR